MKLIFSLLLMLSLTTLFAQDQKPQIVEYRYANGKQYGVDSLGHFHRLDFIKYGKDTLPASILNYVAPAKFKAMEEQQDQKPTQVVAPIESSSYRIPFSDRLNRSGTLLISSGAFFMVGTVVSITSIPTGKVGLAYAGATLSGVGCLLLLGAGVEMLRAGDKFRVESKKGTTLHWKYYGTGGSLSVRF